MSMKILVVDDQKYVRMTISRFLEREQMGTITAENGMSAKRILGNEVVSAVVTDFEHAGHGRPEITRMDSRGRPGSSRYHDVGGRQCGRGG